ncbi:sensor histidine kinase [Bifidobacterium samirii]|uniref:histidine kinase n=1 Tax=Bifidobacterium samirii TaxID=2306974 RepID=A0A430FTN5_9BIFI|nr:HAMP domain-containing sensor histidine kinase [Bifidobacterium samirii]RSX56275.1 sensory transduction protein kinase [Bifidobacterium samirii]
MTRPPLPPRRLFARLAPRTFRGRLTAAILLTTIVTLAGAVAVQNMIVAGVAERQRAALVLCGVDDGDGAVSATCVDGSSGAVPPAPDGEAPDVQFYDAADMTVNQVTDSFVATLRWSSALMLVAFGLLAALLAWIVGGRLSARVSGMCAQVDAMDPADPHAGISVRTGTMDDGDEIDRLAHALNRMLDRARTASEAERRFVSNASHELRTPIAAVETSLDAPLSQGRFPEDVEPAVRRALAANRRGARLVDALLTLSRIQSGTIGATAVTGSGTPSCRPDDIIRHALTDMADAIDERGIRVDDARLLPRTAAVDPTLADLALGNLVRNAVLYNTDHGRLDLAAADDGDAVLVTIANDTDQTAPDDPSELTQPFHRGARSRLSAVPGTGLGLSITLAACQAMHAELDLEQPRPGRFAATVRLPKTD